ncbi:hypothetical protein [Streptomyces nymphaeiformis]|uniref:Lipoprotein n=1 Tax=Streptomyces nymphaeiformis TaxID=2663842 RepID=A0A7W7U9P3_9ACTN|nr:hypothetical protein [Streptomyces nymphaeiformis]MBB4986265.1 hypothetical protein [Streptomyces nymphaeiformis]
MRIDMRHVMAAAAVSAVLVSSGCSAGGGSAPAQAGPSGSPSSPAATRTPDESPGGSVEAAPRLPDGKVIASVADVHGNREIPLEGGARGGALDIMVSCKGKGTVKVSVEPSKTVFETECVAGQVSTNLDRSDLGHDRTPAYVQVEAPASVGWAMSVGRA